MQQIAQADPSCKPDPRLAFLEQASARLILVEAGEMEIEDAFSGLVDQCTCDREMMARWDHDYPPQPPTKTAKPKEAASTTCDALLWELREYGLRRLKHSSTLHRLSQLSTSNYRI
jgi:hypothetical protein